MDALDPPAVPGSARGPADDEKSADSASRRTWLAAERTYLAWLRTGLGALGLALAVGRLISLVLAVATVALVFAEV